VKRWWYSPAIRNSRLVLPSTGFLVVYAGLLLFAEGLDWYSRPEVTRFAQPRVQSPRSLELIFLLGGAVVYGVYRVIAFHPVFRPAYRNWLATTCWRSQQTLPLGPVSLTLTDAFLMLLATGLLFSQFSYLSPFLAVLFFAIAYLLLLTFSLLSSGPRAYAYAVLFGLGWVMTWGTQPTLACGIALATHLVAEFGLRRGLARVADQELKPAPGANRSEFGKAFAAFNNVSARTGASATERARRDPPNLGWPFGYLGPFLAPIRLPVFDAVCVALLAGWLLASLMSCVREIYGAGPSGEDAARNAALFAGFAATVVLGGRMLHLITNYRSSISLVGRLATFRCLIPSYDCAFVAPFAGLVLLTSLGPVLLGVTGEPSIVKVSSLLAVSLLVGLVPGPTQRDWILTSECRIVPMKPPQPPR
jgi:hypothetical protein